MKTRYTDLHTHTNYSDGVGVTPESLVDVLAFNGINVMAKTDHDNLRGYERTRIAADKFGMIALPGVEITTTKYHILGLNFDPNNKEFWDFAEHSRSLQEERSRKRVEVLRGYGVPITLEKVARDFPESRLGKFNITFAMLGDKDCRKYLIENHPNASPNEIFGIYFRSNGIAASVGHELNVSEKEAINAIHNAGGKAGIAHPPKDMKNLDEMDELVKLGIDFVEVQPPFTDKFPYHLYVDYAIKKRLPISYGSDYHGPTMKRSALSKEGPLNPNLRKLLNEGYVKING